MNKMITVFEVYSFIESKAKLAFAFSKNEDMAVEARKLAAAKAEALYELLEEIKGA